jgi:hypothetical protein
MSRINLRHDDVWVNAGKIPGILTSAQDE